MHWRRNEVSGVLLPPPMNLLHQEGPRSSALQLREQEVTRARQERRELGRELDNSRVQVLRLNDTIKVLRERLGEAAGSSALAPSLRERIRTLESDKVVMDMRHVQKVKDLETKKQEAEQKLREEKARADRLSEQSRLSSQEEEELRRLRQEKREMQDRFKCFFDQIIERNALLMESCTGMIDFTTQNQNLFGASGGAGGAGAFQMGAAGGAGGVGGAGGAGGAGSGASGGLQRQHAMSRGLDNH